MIIAYLIWKGSYNNAKTLKIENFIIAYLIWKGSYNRHRADPRRVGIIAYLIWKGSYNLGMSQASCSCYYSISDLERKL